MRFSNNTWYHLFCRGWCKCIHKNPTTTTHTITHTYVSTHSSLLLHQCAGKGAHAPRPLQHALPASATQQPVCTADCCAGEQALNGCYRTLVGLMTHWGRTGVLIDGSCMQQQQQRYTHAGGWLGDVSSLSSQGALPALHHSPAPAQSPHRRHLPLLLLLLQASLPGQRHHAQLCELTGLKGTAGRRVITMGLITSQDDGRQVERCARKRRCMPLDPFLTQLNQMKTCTHQL